MTHDYVFFNESDAVAYDMSRITGGRCRSDNAVYEGGVKIDYAAIKPRPELAELYALRWLMSDDTDDQDCGHVFDLDGRITRYSLLDCDVAGTRRRVAALEGTPYEAEGREILAAVVERHGAFLREARAHLLCKRKNHNFHFNIIDTWDCEEIGEWDREETGRAKPVASNKTIKKPRGTDCGERRVI
ncbi:MAG: hypothetical protein LBP19_00010 [Treponema sp.]|nr:hypothetical protein [Treponema sp.]